MSDMCTDNRFELIEKYKKELVEATNIETSPEEMQVLYNILFRFWQMGWLDSIDRMLLVKESAKTLMHSGGDSVFAKALRNAGRFIQNAIDGEAPEFEKIPSAEPEQKKGKWIYFDPNGFKCSECGGYLEIEVGDVKMNFCPNCGSYNEVRKMTFNGAIMQLVEMRENSMMPVVFKLYFDKVIETLSEIEPAPQWIPCTEDTKFDEFKECWVTMSNGKVKKLYYNPEYMPYPWITRHGYLAFSNKFILAYIPIEKPEPYQSESEE